MRFLLAVLSTRGKSTTRCFENNLHNYNNKDHQQNREYNTADDEMRKLAVLKITLPVCFRLNAKPCCKQTAEKTKGCDTVLFLARFVTHCMHSA